MRDLNGQTWFMPLQKKDQSQPFLSPFIFTKSELQAILQPCSPPILL
ncbi:hypothetical protein RISK_003358 [Rhodopirellula islandica]|uniref:Uncharacterized protein n=1 Tax=Rhodopirellula islandica TaxID=595434 RepID=A0A0J1BDZ9_RHOIS|nr:hypothetical protein RISK_003358 [Rhodopirellula islandica]